MARRSSSRLAIEATVVLCAVLGAAWWLFSRSVYRGPSELRAALPSSRTIAVDEAIVEAVAGSVQRSTAQGSWEEVVAGVAPPPLLARRTVCQVKHHHLALLQRPAQTVLLEAIRPRLEHHERRDRVAVAAFACAHPASARARNETRRTPRDIRRPRENRAALP